MERYISHQLRSVFSALTAAAVCAAVAWPIHGLSAKSPGDLAFGACLLVGVVAFLTLLKASPVKHLTEVRRYRAAPLLTDQAGLATDDSVRRHPTSRELTFIQLLLSLPFSFWVPWGFLLPVFTALDWLGEAAIAAAWERRHGRLLWRGCEGQPWQLAYTPLTPPPPTRTATDAPPG